MADQRYSRKVLNICIICVIIVAIVFAAMMFVLHYDVNGETNMPFFISKISIISTTDGKSVENTEYKWDINVIQNNDIYIYVEKNDGYKKQETINKIKIDNFKIKSIPSQGEIKIYKPVNQNVTSLFENLEEYETTEIVFEGAKSTDTKNLKISNQGGTIGFRCANNNVGNYQSNNDEEIDYSKLLQKMNIDENNLKAIVLFDITLTLNSGKAFKAENVEIRIPNENIVREGRVGIENTNLENIVFKRIEN